MNKIKVLYNAYSISERKFLINFLESSCGRRQSKPLCLIKLLEAKPDISHTEASLALYGDAHSKAFSMLKSKLYDIMLECLMSTSLLKKQKSSRELIRMKIEKMFAEAQVLLQRSLNDLALQQLREATNLAKKHGFSELALNGLINLSRIQKNYTKTEHACLVSELQEARQQAAITADLCRMQLQWDHPHVSSRPNCSEELTPLADELSSLRQPIEAGSNVQNELAFLRLSFYEAIESQNRNKAKHFLQKILDLCQETAQEDDGIAAIPYTLLSKYRLSEFQLNEASKASAAAKKLHRKESFGYQQCSFYEVLVAFHQGEIQTAHQLLEKIELETPVEMYDHNWAQFNFMKANCAFLFGNYHDALESLDQALKININKGGWNMGLRIFEIMIMIELEMFDLIGYKLDTLRKHISRYKGNGRIKTMYSMLVRIERGGFRFDEIKKEQKNLHDMMETFKWTIAGHEMIRFDYWFMSKRKVYGVDLSSAHVVSEMKDINTQVLSDN